MDTMLFDKTGVLTYGASQFVRELLFDDSEDPEDRESAEALLASVERESGSSPNSCVNSRTPHVSHFAFMSPH
ncbi:MAG: hypothetical protein DUD39_18950 [Coriobacteriaceae bacterium]|nr:MAG: hypothetical protein DUD39_18950 [Coriobacteriaceae bacterium]